MLKNYKNTKAQGDAGLGIAIGWFASHSYTVCIPLADSQGYDLIVDGGKGLRRVQVKTTTYKAPSGNFYLSLTVKGGNRSGVGKIKKIGIDEVDDIFAVTGDGQSYLIPISDVRGQSTITLHSKYQRFKV